MIRLATIQACVQANLRGAQAILNDTNIYFTEGDHILDTARTSLIDVHLAADNFEEYECDEPEIIAGVNITNTFKLFKTITNNDVMTFEIKPRCKEYTSRSRANRSDGRPSLTSSCSTSRVESKFEIPVENVVTTLRPPTFKALPGHEQYWLGHRDLRTGNELRMQWGDFANQETRIDTVEHITRSRACTAAVPQHFHKATGMCSNVQLMHETGNRFLILSYNMLI